MKTQKSLKVGDKVLTNKGEYGRILKEWDRESKEYDWWVCLVFMIEGQPVTSEIPYRNSELKKM